MRWAALRRAIRNVLLAVALLSIAGYLARDFLFFTFLYRGTRADWELSQIENERYRARDEFRQEVRRSGDVERGARERLSAQEARLRERCLTLARQNPGKQAELTAWFLVAGQWPDSREAADAREKLLELAAAGDMNHWARMFETSSEPNDESARPLAAALVHRVRENPDHPAAAAILTGACNMVAPDSESEEAPAAFKEIADLITDRYATSPDISNFAEHLGGVQSPPWAQPFEPHLRRILSVNTDRFVRCSCQMALASVVQASGEARQPEAEALYEEFLAEFDGKQPYHAQGIESMHRHFAETQLATIRSHGLGKAAPELDGVDLDGRPMTLKEYRGKVVLVSFWATWCFPCLKLIPHERRLVEQFDRDRFAIVGVNCDTDLEAARAAVDRHGIAWRSFRNEDEKSGRASDRWKIVGYPTLYLLDAEGIVRKRWIGGPPPEVLESSIQRLIAHAAGDGPADLRLETVGRPAAPAAIEYPKIEVAADSPANRGFVGKVHRPAEGGESKYVLFVPRSYDGRTPTPTILFLHGSGYRGSDGRKQLTGALANAIQHREEDFPFLTIFPQSQGEGDWQAGGADGMRAMAILDEVSREYAVDPARVYLTGLSMGGEGTWSLAAAHPGRWAAIVPICGGGAPGSASRFQHIPCWCFHGDADRMIPAELSRKMIRALQEAGGRPLYHEYPGAGHNCWDQTYAMPELYQWLLAQKKAEQTPGER